MIKTFLKLFLFVALFFSQQIHAKSIQPLQCVAFSPYVDHLSPDEGQHPSPELIGKLLDSLIKQTPFRCIMSYGVTNGLEAIFPEAKKRNLKVIAVLWLDKDKQTNTDSISHGIALARQYPKTIIRLSCGSEMRTRNNYDFDDETQRCLDALKEAKVSQPIGVNDTWWEWCNRETPCHKSRFSDQVDWIGINIFPWWENHYFDDFACITAEKAANFHLARWQNVQQTNPTKEVIVTEFGWPNGPEDRKQIRLATGKSCGIANTQKQKIVIESTLKKFAEHHVSSVVFEAFSEKWKPAVTSNSFERFWGLCEGVSPYTCHFQIKLNP